MLDNVELDRTVFALLFASDEPLTVKRIAQVIEASPPEIRTSLDRLITKLDTEKSSTKIEQVALGYQLATRPEYAKYIAKLYSGKRRQRLSRAGLETLSIIAYKQPITRAEIENIRGVSCGGVITTLMERSLIKIVGKARVLGAPFLYGTTQEFLEYLGLNSLKDLPSLKELEALLEQEEYKEEAESGLSELPVDSKESLGEQPASKEILPEEKAGQTSEDSEDDSARHFETTSQKANDTNSDADEAPPR